MLRHFFLTDVVNLMSLRWKPHLKINIQAFREYQTTYQSIMYA